MGYGTYLRQLLAPLAVYDLREGSLSGSELDAIGVGLDFCAEALETAEREGILATSTGEGLDRRAALFAHQPVDYGTDLRREAIMELTRISGDSFTLENINDTISGCGIKAQALEMGSGKIRIIFPDVSGVPDGFDRIWPIILDLIPCHLETEFYFRYITWEECERVGYTWEDIHNGAHTWYTFEMSVPHIWDGE